MKTGVLLFVLIVPCFIIGRSSAELNVDHCETFKTLFSLKSPMLTHVETSHDEYVMGAMLNGGQTAAKRLKSKSGNYLMKSHRGLIVSGLETKESLAVLKANLREAKRKISYFHKLHSNSKHSDPSTCATGKATEPLHFTNSASKMAKDNEVMAAIINRMFSHYPNFKRMSRRTKLLFARGFGMLLGSEAQQECYIRETLEKFKEICESAKNEKDSEQSDGKA